MRTTLKQKLGWLLPGRIDGILLLTVFASACLCLVPWMCAFAREHTSPPQATILRFSIVFGVAVGIVTALDFYFIFGPGSFVRRFVVAILVTAVPLLAVSISFCLAAERKGWGFNLDVFSTDLVCYAVLCQRWAVLSSLGLLSVLLRSLTRQRIGSLGRTPESMAGDKTSIAQFMIMTGLVAVALVSVRFVLEHFPNDWARSSFGVLFHPFAELWTHVEMMKWAAMLELAVVGAYLLLPFLAARIGSRFVSHRWAWWLGAAWFVSWATFFSMKVHSLEQFGSTNLRLVAGTHVGFAIVFVLLKLFASRWGTTMETVKRTEQELSDRRRLVNPVGIAALFFLLIACWVGAYRYDIATFLTVIDNEQRWGISRSVAQISDALKERPTQYRGNGWSGTEIGWSGGDTFPYVRVRTESKAVDRFDLGLSVSNLLNLKPELFRVIRPPFNEVYVEVFDEPTLRATAELSVMRKVYLNLKHLDYDAFDYVMASTEIEELTVVLDDAQVREVDDRLLESLCHQRDSAKAIELGCHIHLTEANAQFVNQLPLSSLDCSFELEEAADFSKLERTTWLSISGSPVSKRILSTLPAKLEQLTIAEWSLADADMVAPICDRDGLSLYLENVHLTPEVTRRLANSTLRAINIDNPEIPIDLEAARELASCENTRIGLVASNIGEAFATKFNVRVGYHAVAGEFEGDPLLNAINSTGSLNAAVAKLANEIEYDEVGNVSELNLQWYRFSGQARQELYKLTSLRRLRMDGCLLTEDVAQLQQLESLELPSDWIPDSVLQHIGKLKKLKRLQLPLFPFCSYYENRRLLHPERIPFPNADLEMSTSYCRAVINGVFDHNASGEITYGEQVDELDNMTAKSVQRLKDLKDLKELEYLWIPGPFLHPDTISTIEGFPRLEELHALHTAVDPLVLQRVAKLTNIKKLSIGVAEFDETVKEVLQSMQHLEVLQIYVIKMPFDEDYELDRVLVESQLKTLLPTTEIHLITHERLSWIAP